MSYRRVIQGLFIVLLGSLVVLNACSSSNNGDELQQSLADQSFQLEFADLAEAPLLDCVTGLVPDASLSPTDGSGDGTQILSTLTVDIGDTTISFTGNEFSIEANGEVISAGTWAAIDNQTIDITENGLSSPFGVTIDGNTLILEVTQDTIDTLCSPDTETPQQDGPNPGVSDDIGDPSQLAMLLMGNWCYESGYELYYAFNISVADPAPSGFALNDAVVLIDEGDEPVTRAVGINEFLLTSWIDTNRLSSQFHRYAPITVDENDPSALLVEFGPDKEAIYRRSDSELLGDCAMVPIAEDTPAADTPAEDAPAEAAPAEEVPAAEVTQ